MSRDIKAILHLKKYNELFNVMVVGIIFVMMFVLSFIFSKDGSMNMDEARVMMIGGIVGGYIGISLFFKIFFIADEVPRGLTFGMTRRKLFVSFRIVDFLEILILSVLALVLIHEADVSLILKAAALLFGVFMWVEGLAGNNVVRYGKIVYWIYYFVFLFVVIALPRLDYFIPGFGTPLAVLADHFINPVYNQVMVWTTIIAFGFVGFIVNWITFRRIPVNYAA